MRHWSKKARMKENMLTHVGKPRIIIFNADVEGLTCANVKALITLLQKT